MIIVVSFIVQIRIKSKINMKNLKFSPTQGIYRNLMLPSDALNIICLISHTHCHFQHIQDHIDPRSV